MLCQQYKVEHIIYLHHKDYQLELFSAHNVCLTFSRKIQPVQASREPENVDYSVRLIFLFCLLYFKLV